MKKVYPVCILFVLAFFANSCTKCFTCQNTCQQCTGIIDSTINTFTLCRDSFVSDQQFQAAIAADTALGYICKATGSTYNESYCSNKPGETYYPNYYDRGGRVTCTAK